MIPAKYYTILGLHHNANARDVKGAYRSLVKQYHPDVNPSKEAHQKFLKITEAYEIITGQRPVPQSRSRRQTPQNSGTPHTKTQEQINKERVERIKREKELQAKKEYLAQLKIHELYVTGWRKNLFNAVLFTSIVCLLLIILDYNLPEKITKHRVDRSEYLGISITHSLPYHLVYYDNNKRLEVIGGTGENLEPDDIFYLTNTAIMNEKREFILKSGNYGYYAKIKGSIYSILPIAVIFLLLPIIARYMRQNIWAYATTYKLAVAATGLFLLYFLFEEMRILRMLQIIN